MRYIIPLLVIILTGCFEGATGPQGEAGESALNNENNEAYLGHDP